MKHFPEPNLPSSEPSKKRKKKPTDPNNFEPGQELEFNVNDTVIKGKFIRYDLEDEEKVLIETTYDMLYEHGLNSNAPGSVQRIHKSWLVEKKKPTGILKEKVKLRKTLPAHIRGKKLVDKIEKYFGLKWFRYKDVKGIFDKTDHNNFFILVNAGIFKHIGSQYILRSAKMSSQYILERLENVKKEEVRKETIKAAIFLLENEGFKITKP